MLVPHFTAAVFQTMADVNRFKVPEYKDYHFLKRFTPNAKSTHHFIHTGPTCFGGL